MGAKFSLRNTFVLGNSFNVGSYDMLKVSEKEKWNLNNTVPRAKGQLSCLAFLIVIETMRAQLTDLSSQTGNAIAQIKTSEYFCLLLRLRQLHFGNHSQL